VGSGTPEVGLLDGVGLAGTTAPVVTAALAGVVGGWVVMTGASVVGGVSVIGLRPCHRVALPIPGHCQWVDRVHRPPCRPQRRDQQPAWSLDRHRKRRLGAITGSSEHFDEFAEPAGVVGDTLLGDQPAAVVDDGDVVMGFGPINAAEQQCHV
jgi:hypothetical protein